MMEQTSVFHHTAKCPHCRETIACISLWLLIHNFYSQHKQQTTFQLLPTWITKQELVGAEGKRHKTGKKRNPKVHQHLKYTCTGRIEQTGWWSKGFPSSCPLHSSKEKPTSGGNISPVPQQSVFSSQEYHNLSCSSAKFRQTSPQCTSLAGILGSISSCFPWLCSYF